MPLITSIGDVHLDACTHSVLDPKVNRQTATLDALSALDQCLTASGEAGAEAVFIPGDIFDGPRPIPEDMESFADLIRSAVKRYGFMIGLCDGNHEVNGLPSGHRSCLHRFKDMKGVRVFSRPGFLETPSGYVVGVIPWAHQSERDGLSVDEWTEMWIAKLARKVDLNALTGHMEFSGAAMGAYATSRGSETVLSKRLVESDLSPETLAGMSLDIVTLNHIHIRQGIGWELKSKKQVTEGGIMYNGSITRVTFGEENLPKSLTLFEGHGNGSASVWTQDIDVRELATVWVGDPSPEKRSTIRLRHRHDQARSEIQAAIDQLRRDGHTISVIQSITPDTGPSDVPTSKDRSANFHSAMKPDEATKVWLRENGYDGTTRMGAMKVVRHLLADDKGEATK